MKPHPQCSRCHNADPNCPICHEDKLPERPVDDDYDVEDEGYDHDREFGS